MTTTYQIGQKVHLPDGPYGAIVRIEEGTEYSSPVWYLTVVNGFGTEETRWVRR